MIYGTPLPAAHSRSENTSRSTGHLALIPRTISPTLGDPLHRFELVRLRYSIQRGEKVVPTIHRNHASQLVHSQDGKIEQGEVAASVATASIEYT